jgi:deazaflavin-dependent oxidoreductase (nitroreductase family)
MDDSIRRALGRGHTIDMTTTGRRTAKPRRIELVFHNIDGRLIISGSPNRRTRGWIYNLEADPHLTFHLKRSVHADLPATGRVISDPAERRQLAEWIVANAWPNQDVETMVRFSPFVEVTIDELATDELEASPALDRV